MKKIGYHDADTYEFYKKYGFAIFRNVFTPDEVKQLRQGLVESFSQKSSYPDDWDNKELLTSVRFDFFNRYKDFRWVLFKQGITDALNTVLGKPHFILTESVAHYEGFGAWHKDTTTQEKMGERFHYDEDFNMIECGIYLQDNDPVYGGGLDIVPFSHLDKSDPFVPVSGKGKLSGLMNRIKNYTSQKNATKNGVQLETKAGDFVVFNKKATHRASPCNVPSKPKEMEKYAIFFLAGSDNVHVKLYTNFIKKRYDYMKDYKLDEGYRQACEEKGVKLVLPD
jgi:hypothetical protein